MLKALFYSGILPLIVATNSSQLEITPLWDTTQNYTGSCIINDDDTNDTINFYGSVFETCHLQVATHSEFDTQVGVHITGNVPEESFFYIERKGALSTINCWNRYVVVGGQLNESCGVIFTHNSFQLTLQGTANISMTVVPKAEPPATAMTASSATCPENENPLHPKAEPTTSACPRWIRGYNEITTCTWFKPVPGICALNFNPSHCNTTVGFKEVIFTCLESNNIPNRKVLIFYPDGMIALDLTDKKIDKLTSKAFIGLESLQRLHLRYNRLKTLPSGVFSSLSNLGFLDLSNNKLYELDVGIFESLKNLRLLFLNNNNLTRLPNQLFNGITGLVRLFLYGNQISTLQTNQFKSLSWLNVLLLRDNSIETLHSYSLSGLRSLEILVLSNNQIAQLEPEIFKDLVSLKTMYVPSNQLTELNNDIFATNLQLVTIDLSSNKLKEIPDIHHLTHLNYLDLIDNPLIDVNKAMLSSLSLPSYVAASQHEICQCFVPPNVTCSAADDRSPYLSCDRLLSDKMLASIMWVIGLTALGGNLFVLIWRRKSKPSQKNKIQDLLLNNLAISDLLMGVYMLIIACADVYFGAEFPMRSEKWRTGVTCRVAGALSILSSEASVFFVTIISIDRLICIKYPHASRALRNQLSHVAVVLLWLIALALGIIPSALSGINFKFYDNSHVCIGLPLALTQLYSSVEIKKEICPEGDGSGSCYTIPHLTTETGPLVSGMYFSSAVFLGLNCLCYIVVLGCYVEVVRVVYKSSKRAGLNKEMREQMRLTFKVAAIVITDFACWFPVILLGILVQSGVLNLPPSVYAWSVTFVLPINSAINPYLYTIAAIISNHRKRKIGDSSTASQNSS